ncbi:MAG: hypothetical protein QM639_15950 [Rhodocyclaceae bacterium]
MKIAKIKELVTIGTGGADEIWSYDAKADVLSGRQWQRSVVRPVWQ